MTKTSNLLAIVAAILFMAITPVSAASSVSDLRVEYLKNPLGIDTREPRLSWRMEVDARARGQKQTAYHLLVASSREKLNRNQGDLWDSGKVESDQSIHVRYRGKPLESHQQCFWKVRVWDAERAASAWSKPASWSVGLLQPSDWKAQWIGKDEKEQKFVLQDTSWIWFPDANPANAAPVGKRFFRRTIELNRSVKSAQLLVTGDNLFVAFVNGEKVGEGGNFKSAFSFHIGDKLRTGRNNIAISVDNTGESANPAGLVALLKVEFEQGEPLTLATDESWKSSDDAATDWHKPEFDDAKWTAAKKLGPVGMGPWGEVGAPEERRLAARYLRKEFSIDKKIQRATAYISGLGLSELYINNNRISDHVLSPGLTEYNKRVFYVTHDITPSLKRGKNAVGVILGNGRYFAPRLKVPTETRTYGFPKLLFQLHIDYTDGTSEQIVSDASWRLTNKGSIRANNEYDGEEYDARLEMPGWSSPRFDDSKWESVQMVSAPGGKLESQMTEPIRVTQTIKPVSMKEIKPGVYIYDMGQNMVGWCRLTVSGPAGTEVNLRHAEILKDDGSLYMDNIRSAQVTASYTLKGSGAEVYEPRFTYFGFRYVEVTGFPGKPSLTSIEGRVVHDDLEKTGDFVSSNPLLNRIYENVVWGVRGNYRSFPTDCPQRDERQAWLGDRANVSRGESYMFDIAPLYTKWMRDIADAQRDNGSISDVSPSYWPLYSDNVTWPSTAVIVPGMLRDQFADTFVIEKQYEAMKKWVDHMSTFVKDGIIDRDSYGDWCVPPEEQTLIHSKDPNRKTSKAVLATTYFYHDLRLMQKYASMLGKTDDVQRYNDAAERIKTAFNAKYLDKERGYYDNGTQTSCVLPLAFGMVPEDYREKVFNHLVIKITDETKGHIGTGLVGGQWLNRVLSDHGRIDLTYGIATKTDYPSWGYMVEKDATTIWELWNGDTADPAMNSGNHVMLVGDLVIWMYEYLGGIKPDPDYPGFKRIVMRPHPVGDLTSVKATHRSPYGWIRSDWKLDAGTFTWNVTVPPNSTATVFVPAQAVNAVRESGKPATERPGIQFLGMDKGAAMFNIGSGTFRFESR